MSKVLKRLMGFLLCLSLILAGCGAPAEESDPTESGETTFWIVTEEGRKDGMNDLTELLIEEFEATHENVKIKLEVLPDWIDHPEEREVRLKQIRTEILAGYGPDAYLIPTAYQHDPLFPDVRTAMANGIFADLSAYYDADTQLGTGDLHATVMDAGVLDGARYVLPLRYNIPVVYGNTAALESSGLGRVVRESDWSGMVQALDDSGLGDWARFLNFGGSATAVSLLRPEVIDYSSGEVVLSPEDAAKFLSDHQAIGVMSKLRADGAVSDFGCYIDMGEFLNEEYPVEMHNLTMMLNYTAIAAVEEQDITILPIRAAGGDLVAQVTYYAAVGVNCQHPELAYEFLREFLTAESQWQQNRIITNPKDHNAWIDYGWPVRTVGSVSALWEQFKTHEMDIESADGSKRKRVNALKHLTFTDEDFPILDVPIDRVVFPGTVDQEIIFPILMSLNDDATDVDIQETAEEMIFQLQIHFAEG